jgi:hypothetical protein
MTLYSVQRNLFSLNELALAQYRYSLLPAPKPRAFNFSKQHIALSEPAYTPRIPPTPYTPFHNSHSSVTICQTASAPLFDPDDENTDEYIHVSEHNSQLIQIFLKGVFIGFTLAISVQAVFKRLMDTD